MEDIRIILPIYIQVTKKNNFALNLNQYRNAHHFTLNNSKIIFEKDVAKLIAHLPSMKKVELTYNLFLGSRRSSDLSNICCIVDKYFSDTLVNCKKLIDDSIEHITDIHYHFGGIELKNPYVEVVLSNIELIEEEPMRITLVRSEIHQALVDYVKSQINIKEGQSFSIDLVGSEEGFTANVNIEPVKKGSDPAPFVTDSVKQSAESVTKAGADVQAANMTEMTALPVSAPEPAVEASKEDIFKTPAVNIFPTEGSSTPTPVANPKSLFADLEKPKNNIS